jgi:hypothetical protein
MYKRRGEVKNSPPYFYYIQYIYRKSEVRFWSERVHQHRDPVPTGINLKKYMNMENESFPSSIQEGCLRLPFSLVTLSIGGDGVVIAKSKWLIPTTSPKSMI